MDSDLYKPDNGTSSTGTINTFFESLYDFSKDAFTSYTEYKNAENEKKRLNLEIANANAVDSKEILLNGSQSNFLLSDSAMRLGLLFGGFLMVLAMIKAITKG